MALVFEFENRMDASHASITMEWMAGSWGTIRPDC